MSQYETLEISDHGSVVWVAVNRPDALNALNRTVLTELLDIGTKLGAREGLDAVVLTGKGRAFVAGADIKAMLNYSAEEAQEFSELGHRAFASFEAIPCPVIGALNGFALGGGLELALACDLLYASDKARLGLPEVSLSVIPGWGGTQRLGRRIGWHHARELVFTGKQIRPDEAKRIGLVLDVFPIEEFESSIQGIVDSITKNGPLALRAAKAAMAHGSDGTLADGILHEQAAFGGLFGTADQREGMTAFVERRAPEWSRS